jgi:hypothetical protein
VKKVEKIRNSEFRTHIREPRWQQIASVVVVVIFILLEIWDVRSN